MIRIKNLKRNKKAQAAMEFLTTYGWAILILIIIIVALANLGVFKGPRTPNSCTSAPPISCSDVSLSAAGILDLNMAAEGTQVATIAATGVSVTIGPTTYTSTSVAGTLRDTLSKISTDDLNGVVDFTAGSKFKGTVTVSYTVQGGLPKVVDLTFAGTI